MTVRPGLRLKLNLVLLPLVLGTMAIFVIQRDMELMQRGHWRAPTPRRLSEISR